MYGLIRFSYMCFENLITIGYLEQQRQRLEQLKEHHILELFEMLLFFVNECDLNKLTFWKFSRNLNVHLPGAAAGAEND